MRRFTRLFHELDRTTRTGEKIAALEAYFRDAAPEDAAWALYVLIGRRVKRAVQGRLLRVWAAEEAGLPLWLVEESYHQVGDLAETLALIFPDRGGTDDGPLHELIHRAVTPLPDLQDDAKRRLVVDTLGGLDAGRRLVFLKLITGAFRIGVGNRLVIRALAAVAGVDPATMAHRVSGSWQPTAEVFRGFLAPEQEDDPARPYPFFLAHPLQMVPEKLGALADWQAEWKWDGVRLQLIRRRGQALLWSRGEELVGHQFPEIAEAAATLPEGTVLDGETLAWKDGRPLPFGSLQRRLGRKSVGARLREQVPVAFLAYDLLEEGGEDVRPRPLSERRRRLEALVTGLARLEQPEVLLVSEVVEAGTWEKLAALRVSARERAVEGLMLKSRASEYGVGRPRGAWWKWKVDPLQVDAVLLYAQAGHGRRAGLFTDYTFGVWNGDRLVTIAKAYSGLTDVEIRRLDSWIRRHTLERFGPVRSVQQEHVFELHFDDIRRSSRHRSGVALRFPRIARWRHDKRPAEADSLAMLERLLGAHGGG